jgi:hypothetical protein
VLRRLTRGPEPGTLLTIALYPKPVELEGLNVGVAGQCEKRRFLSARPVRVVSRC